MRTVRCFFVVLLLIQIVSIFELKGQQYLENYPGIPIISYSWELQWKDYNYQKKKEAGITAITATIVNETIFNKAKDNELKIIPYPGNKSNAGFMVAKYTDAAYTVWEAEGYGDSSEYATLVRAGTNICDTYNDNGTECIITTANLSGAPNEEVILRGPGYTQQNKYIIRETAAPPANVRIYTASFKMKLQRINPQIPITGFEDSIICRLRVYAKNDLGSEYTIKDTSIKVSDLILNSWKEIETIYQLDTLPLDYYHSYSKPSGTTAIKYFAIEGTEDKIEFAERIFFEVTWKKVSNLRLLVDKITCYDERGRELKHEENTQADLLDQINNTNNNGNNTYKLNVSDFDSTCIGWMALDEPPTIDNYEPVRFIDSIIAASSNGQRKLHVSTLGSWESIYGGNGFAPKDVVIFKEMAKRMGWERKHFMVLK